MKKLELRQDAGDDIVKFLSYNTSSDFPSFKRVCAEMDDYTWEVVPPDTFNKELIGNWFLYMNRDGDIFVTKDVPQRTESGAVHLKNISTCKSGWMQLTSSGATLIAPAFSVGTWTLKPSDFNNLRLPRLKKNSIIEIEIMPSGKVYFY